MAEFPSVGPPGFRIFRVGGCRICGLVLTWDEKDGPPEAQDICSFCEANEGMKNKAMQKRHAARRTLKTRGEEIIEAVSKRHRDKRGVSLVKMPPAARRDLVDEINRVVGADK